jgi:2-desacetyl-2-hydroxyethyl bacteriochlorophyllide A dehydrogenase
MTATRKALWTEDGLEIVETELPPLPDGWARVRVEACGICGSDLHFWTGHTPRPKGSAPGHEFVGTLVDGPAGMADARYAVCPAMWCGQCEYCITGATHLCSRLLPGIGLGRDGGLAELADAPAKNLFRVDDAIDPVVASLAEPLAVALRGVAIGAPGPESRVLVLGAGTVGLMTALAVRGRGTEVAITARYPHQQAAAAAMGATVLTEDEVNAWGKEHRPDVVLETVGGSANTLNTAFRVARRGGRIVVLGVFEPVKLDLGYALLKELQILTSFAYGVNRRGSEFQTAVDLLPRWRDELAGVLTHQYSLDDVGRAFDTAADKTSGALKVTITPAGP